MCLASVKEVYDNPCPMVQDGWKKFGGTDSKPAFEAFGVGGKNTIVPLDKWIKATKEHAPSGVRATDGNMYDPGFHVFAEEPKSKTGYRRVFVRNISSRGKDSGTGSSYDHKEVIIAQEMYVPSDPNGWPPNGGSEEEPPAPKGGGGSGEPRRANPLKKFIDKTIDDMKAKGVTPGQA